MKKTLKVSGGVLAVFIAIGVLTQDSDPPTASLAVAATTTSQPTTTTSTTGPPPTQAEPTITPTTAEVEADEMAVWVFAHGPVTLAYLDLVAEGSFFIAEVPESTRSLACLSVVNDLEPLMDDLLAAADAAPRAVETPFRQMTSAFAFGLSECLDDNTDAALAHFNTSTSAMADFTAVLNFWTAAQ